MAGEYAFSGPSADVGNATTEALFCYANATTTSVTLALPANGENKNRLFRVYVAARIQPGTSGNVTVNLYGGTTVTSGNVLATTGVVSTASNTSAILECVFHWNDDTDTLLGYQTGIAGATPTLTTLAINANKYSSNPNPTAASTLNLVVGCLFGTSNSANHAYLDVFTCNQL